MYFLLMFVLYFQPVNSVRCGCTATTCNQDVDRSDCNGEYCYAYRSLPTIEVEQKGCLTTRQEIPSNFTCEEDRKGGITCVCKSDFCNSNSLEISPIVKAPILICTAQSSNLILQTRATCRGHNCKSRGYYEYNKYGDFIDSGMEKKCGDTNFIRILDVNLDISDDICYMQTWGGTADLHCYCKINYCTDRAVPEIMIGNVTCYTFTAGKFGKCKGQYCAQINTQKLPGIREVQMACLSLPNGFTLAENSFNIVDGYTTFVCSTDYCNGFPLKTLASGSYLLYLTVAVSLFRFL